MGIPPKKRKDSYDDLTIVDPHDPDNEPTLGPTPVTLDASEAQRINAEAMIGRVLGGQYVLERVLGSGGAGTVFQARDRESPHLVAVKVLHLDRSFDDQFVRRFHREALAAKHLEHESVVRMFAFGEEDDGTLFLAMEYVPGRSLKELLAESGPQPFGRIVDLMAQVCEGLAVAHAKGIVHRDVTPANILIIEGFDANGDEIEKVKLCDFGVARLPPTIDMDQSVSGAHGGIVGTAEYMSPEQVRGDSLDARSDVYSCGAVLYEMATGKVPFDAASPVTIMLAHLNEDPVSPRKHAPAMDRALEMLIMRCLRKEPADRPQSAMDLRAALKALRS